MAYQHDKGQLEIDSRDSLGFRHGPVIVGFFF